MKQGVAEHRFKMYHSFGKQNQDTRKCRILDMQPLKVSFYIYFVYKKNFH